MNQPAAVVDTNVMLEVFTCTDLTEAFYKHLGLGTAVALDHPEVEKRRIRIRRALLLAMYLDKIRAVTYSLLDEMLAQVAQRAPPDGKPNGKSLALTLPTGDLALEGAYAGVLVHFVKDYVLPGWTMAAAPGVPPKVTGNRADTALVMVAANLGLSLITNEVKPKGRISKDARNHKVATCPPGKFYEGQLSEDEEIEAFLGRYRAAIPAFLASLSADPKLQAWYSEALPWVLGILHLILRDERAEGRTGRGVTPGA